MDVINAWEKQTKTLKPPALWGKWRTKRLQTLHCCCGCASVLSI